MATGLPGIHKQVKEKSLASVVYGYDRIVFVPFKYIMIKRDPAVVMGPVGGPCRVENPPAPSKFWKYNMLPGFGHPEFDAE